MTISNNDLLASGFIDVSTSADDGPAFEKRMLVDEMPYAREHIVGDCGVDYSDTAVIYINRERMAIFRVEGTDYSEEPVSIDSADGLGILKDAGFKQGSSK